MFAITQHEMNCLDDGGRAFALESIDHGTMVIV